MNDEKILDIRAMINSALSQLNDAQSLLRIAFSTIPTTRQDLSVNDAKTAVGIAISLIEEQIQIIDTQVTSLEELISDKDLI